MNSTSLTYAEVENTIEDIRVCRDRMAAIFEEFNKEVGSVTSAGSFEGSASETFKNKYNALAQRFTDYCNLVEEFAERVKGAEEREQYTEREISKDAQNLHEI